MKFQEGDLVQRYSFELVESIPRPLTYADCFTLSEVTPDDHGHITKDVGHGNGTVLIHLRDPNGDYKWVHESWLINLTR
jgi:hypothetical protein